MTFSVSNNESPHGCSACSVYAACVLRVFQEVVLEQQKYGLLAAHAAVKPIFQLISCYFVEQNNKQRTKSLN